MFCSRCDNELKSYLLTGSSSDLVRFISEGVLGVRARSADDWLSFFLDVVNLPSSHRAAFPPFFAGLIPFPYKAREGETTCTSRNTPEVAPRLDLLSPCFYKQLATAGHVTCPGEDLLNTSSALLGSQEDPRAECWDPHPRRSRTFSGSGRRGK